MPSVRDMLRAAKPIRSQLCAKFSPLGRLAWPPAAPLTLRWLLAIIAAWTLAGAVSSAATAQTPATVSPPTPTRGTDPFASPPSTAVRPSGSGVGGAQAAAADPFAATKSDPFATTNTTPFAASKSTSSVTADDCSRAATSFWIALAAYDVGMLLLAFFFYWTLSRRGSWNALWRFLVPLILFSAGALVLVALDPARDPNYLACLADTENARLIPLSGLSAWPRGLVLGLVPVLIAHVLVVLLYNQTTKR